MSQDAERKSVALQEVRGLPGIRGTDHIGFTVPDMEQAHEFFVNVIGCQHVYSLGPYPQDPGLMRTKLNVHPEATLLEIRFYRCFNGANFEVFNYVSPDQRREQPRNSDVGGHHIAFYVDDVAAAKAYLEGKGVATRMGPLPVKEGPAAGQTILYFQAPWGLQFEAISYPTGMAYEKGADTVLWSPKDPAK